MYKSCEIEQYKMLLRVTSIKYDTTSVKFDCQVIIIKYKCKIKVTFN